MPELLGTSPSERLRAGPPPALPWTHPGRNVQAALGKPTTSAGFPLPDQRCHDQPDQLVGDRPAVHPPYRWTARQGGGTSTVTPPPAARCRLQVPSSTSSSTACRVFAHSSSSPRTAAAPGRHRAIAR